MEGCDVGAIFNTATAMLPKAQQTGKFTLRAETLARKLKVDSEGRVHSVSVVDRATRREENIRAKIFIVCCASIESARLLLNSRSEKFPNGLANSSDRVGRYLHGHSICSIRSYLEELAGTPSSNEDGAMDHAYIPRNNMDDRKRGFAGGYGFQTQHSGFMFPYHARNLQGFGQKFKKGVRFLQPGFFQMGGWGKILAQPENRVTVNSNKLDAFGIPIPVINFTFSENDKALWNDMCACAEEILHKAGIRHSFRRSSGPAGFSSHEVGTARMGSDPKKSVLNSYCQTHDVRNLFVVDGSCFVTSPEKNPTLTIMALALRAVDYIRQSQERGEL